MHNLKELRKNLDKLVKKFKDRNVDFNINDFKKDALNRDLISKKEKLEQEKSLSKSKDKSILRNLKRFLKKYLI